MYKNREYIACIPPPPANRMEGLCIFVDNIKDGVISGYTVKISLQKMMNNGCEKCGQVALIYDNLDAGMIKVDFVDDGCGYGLCKK